MVDEGRRQGSLGVYWKLVVTAAVVAVAWGCAGGAREVRGEQAERFQEEIAQRSQEATAAGGVLGLEECIRIALLNNAAVKSREIEAKIATIERQAAFGNFLPQVELEFSYNKTDDQQAIWTGMDCLPISDRSVTHTVVRAQQPIFGPGAWYLYSMRKRGAEVGGLVAERTRQLIRLQVTAQYYGVLSLGETLGYLERSVAEAEMLLGETAALEREGLVTESRRQGAEVLAESRRWEYESAKRSIREAKAGLLETMGLWPLAEVEFAEEEAVAGEERELEEQVSEALANRLELHAADRVVEMSRDRLRMSVASFLPSLFAVGGYVHSNDGYLKYPDLWSYGVSGVMTVFDGFRNINEYKAARASREEAFLRREEQCLAVMLEVVRARLQSEDAEEALAVARKGLEAAESVLRESEALWREGLAEGSRRLEAIGGRDRAQAQVALAEYHRRVAYATLADVTGKPGKDIEDEQ